MNTTMADRKGLADHFVSVFVLLIKVFNGNSKAAKSTQKGKLWKKLAKKETC